MKIVYYQCPNCGVTIHFPYKDEVKISTGLMCGYCRIKMKINSVLTDDFKIDLEIVEKLMSIKA